MYDLKQKTASLDTYRSPLPAHDVHSFQRSLYIPVLSSVYPSHLPPCPLHGPHLVAIVCCVLSFFCLLLSSSLGRVCLFVARPTSQPCSVSCCWACSSSSFFPAHCANFSVSAGSIGTVSISHRLVSMSRTQLLMRPVFIASITTSIGS